MEFVFQDVLKAIEAATGGKITVLSAASPREPFEKLPEPCLAFNPSIPDFGEEQLQLHLPSPSLQKFSRYLNANAARPSADSKPFGVLSFPACIRLAAMALSQEELAVLTAGDVIMLDQKGGAPAAALVIGETIAAPLAIEGGTATLADHLRRASGSPLEGMTANGAAQLIGSQVPPHSVSHPKGREDP